MALMFPIVVIGGLVLLGLLAGAVVLVVVLARRKAWGGPVGLGVGVVLLALLALGAYRWFLEVPVSHRSVAYKQDRPREMRTMPEPPDPPPAPQPPSRWQHEMPAAAPQPTVPVRGTFVTLAVILVVVGGVVLAVVLAGRRKLGWVLGAVGIAMAVAMVGAAVLGLLMSLWAFRSSAGPTRAREAEMGATEAVPSPERWPGPAAPLPVDVEAAAGSGGMSAFLADVYPSREQAVQALVRSLADSLAAAAPEGAAELPLVHVMGDPGAPAVLLGQVAEAFQRSGAVRVGLAAERGAATSRPAADSRITCTIRADEGEQGAVQLTLSGPRGQATRSSRFVAKPWAANFGLFASQTRESRTLARSGRPCTSPEEAEHLALEDAAAKLLPRVNSSLMRGIARHYHSPDVQVGLPELRARIRVELEQGYLIQDRLLQRYQRPYGSLWQESLLVDSSPAGVDRLAGAIAQEIVGSRRAGQESWVRWAATIGGLAVLILAAYLVLNAATKGYYAWVLRLAAIGLVLAGAIAVLCMA